MTRAKAPIGHILRDLYIFWVQRFPHFQNAGQGVPYYRGFEFFLRLVKAVTNAPVQKTGPQWMAIERKRDYYLDKSREATALVNDKSAFFYRNAEVITRRLRYTSASRSL